MMITLTFIEYVRILNENFPVYGLTTIFIKIYSIFFLTIGTIGNTLSFIILTSKEMRKTSTFCYLACLSVVDLTVNYTFSLNFIATYFFQYDIQVKSQVACRFFAFLVYFLPQLSAWILVWVSLDRVFKIISCSGKLLSKKPIKKVIFPQKNGFIMKFLKKWNTPRGSLITVLLTACVLFTVNVQFFILDLNNVKNFDDSNILNGLNETYNNFDIDHIESLHNTSWNDPNSAHFNYYRIRALDINPILCSPENSPKYKYFYKTFWVHLDTLVNVFVPSFIMLMSSCIICSTIRKSLMKFRRRSRLVSVFYDRNINNKTNKKSFVHKVLSSKKISKEEPIKPNNLSKRDLSNKRCSSVPNLVTLNPPLSNKMLSINENTVFGRVVRVFSKRSMAKTRRIVLRKPDKFYVLVILVAMNILFLILTAPIVIYMSLQVDYIHKIEPLKKKVFSRFIKSICICLMNTNHAINIMIYGLVGTIFRKKLFHILNTFKQKLLECCTIKKRRHGVQGVSTLKIITQISCCNSIKLENIQNKKEINQDFKLNIDNVITRKCSRVSI